MPRDDAIDTRGLYCPVPILRAQDRMRRVPAGTVIEIVSDDPAVLVDMPAFCRSHGHDFLGHREEPDGAARVRIRKGGETT